MYEYKGMAPHLHVQQCLVTGLIHAVFGEGGSSTKTIELILFILGSWLVIMVDVAGAMLMSCKC
jgi:hypothetical protein